MQGLVALGTRYDCVIELVPQVGNYVAPGDPLFRVYGGAGLPAEALRQSIALGRSEPWNRIPCSRFG